MTRTTTHAIRGGVWWTTDGWIHVAVFDRRDRTRRLYRVPVAGGKLEPEPPIDFESDAGVNSMAHDGRRAVVQAQSSTTDLWVLRVAPE